MSPIKQLHFKLQCLIGPDLVLFLFLLAQVGDGTNFVLVLAGALLENAEELLRMGLSPSEVIEGYQMAGKKALSILPSECGLVGVATRNYSQ